MVHVAIETSRVMRCREHMHNFGSAQEDNAHNEDLSIVKGINNHAPILFGTHAKQFHA